MLHASQPLPITVKIVDPKYQAVSFRGDGCSLRPFKQSLGTKSNSTPQLNPDKTIRIATTSPMKTGPRNPTELTPHVNRTKPFASEPPLQFKSRNPTELTYPSRTEVGSKRQKRKPHPSRVPSLVPSAWEGLPIRRALHEARVDHRRGLAERARHGARHAALFLPVEKHVTFDHF